MTALPSTTITSGNLVLAFACLILVGGIFLAYTATGQENAVIYTKQITISGKICTAELSNEWGTLSDEKLEKYFFASKDCEKYHEGMTVNISYNRIHQFGTSDVYDFNRIIKADPVDGDQSFLAKICNQSENRVNSCDQQPENLIVISVYMNATDKDPLWTQIKASTDCGKIPHDGYSQRHILSVYPSEKLTLAVTRIFDPDTGNTTLIQTTAITLYPSQPEYRIILNKT